MARCRECNRDISRVDDQDICPYCGCSHPIDSSYETKDITSLTLDKTGEGYSLYKSKSRKNAGIFCLLLGYLGIHNFYLGFIKKAIIDIAITIVLVLGVGLPVFFAAWPSALAFIIPFLAAFVGFAIYSIHYFKGDSLKDSRGEFLR